MRFIGRHEELRILNKLHLQSDQGGLLTVLTGRRRVGKTTLSLQFAGDKRFLYLFVGRKDEHLLCQEFLEEIKKHFTLPVIGEIKAMKDLFALLLEVAKKEKFVLIFDEFQEFFHINPSVYSDFQKLWDMNKAFVRLHLIFIGSVYSLMHKIFQDKKEPLFGRADRILHIKPFLLSTLKDFLDKNNILTAEHFFHFYLISGCMPKYLDILIKEGACDRESIFDIIFQKDAFFLSEGKNLLIEEFGKDYLNYFAILELISQGKTARSAIESILEKDVGGYLLRLEEDYAIITRHRPIHAKIHTRNQKYKIVDNFLNFWFRFIYRYRTAIEIENFEYVKAVVLRDYASFCGPLLERFFHQLLAETHRFSEIGSYWEKDNQNEIDIVAVNDLEKRIVIAEIKLKKTKINLSVLETKAHTLLKHYPAYKPTFLRLSIEDAFNIDTLLSA